MTWRKLTKKDLINMMRKLSFVTGGLTEEKIMHSTAVADLALKLADSMIKDGIDVDRQAAYTGALLHEVGLAKVGISEAVRSSPEHDGWGGWLCRKWGFPDSVAQCPETHECLTPELAKRLYFPEPIQKTYFPTCTEAKLTCFCDWSSRIANSIVDPWKDPVARKEFSGETPPSYWVRETPDDHPMIKANIGITKEMLEDRRKKAVQVGINLRKECFLYLKKEYFTKCIRERWGHLGWSMGPWFPLPKRARQPTNLDLSKLGKVYTQGKWRKLV